MSIKALFSPLVIIFILFSSSLAQSHPHAWVDLKSAPLFDDQGRLTGLRLHWLFGDFYSAFVLSEIPKNDDGTPREDALQLLATGNLKNLSEFDYFTKVRISDKKAPLKPVDQFTTGVVENRLWMEFDVMLEKPVNPSGKAISYAVNDPTYYIEILHHNKEPAISLAHAPSDKCTAELIPPSPPEDMSVLAANMDKGENVDFSLGDYFAEWVHITCD
ncbi:DUF1007 family protein [Sneathiella glossodoripedis]|uniref:DUF1007 family protein n=1 Tax=Sneathiella glossodoripedis TaxID=418853 RepID=UPI000470997B|nr:DUF1007 family protein [Sneathiella glossodoripedis]